MAVVFPINPSASPAHPEYSGDFIPTLWAKKFLERFYDATVLAQISQTDYEGEIKNQGDKVIINRVPTISIVPYRMGDTLTYERPPSDTTELLIDQGRAWAFQLDDVADVQAFTNMLTPWAENASEELKIEVDTDVLAFLVGKCDPANTGAAAGRIAGNLNLGSAATPVGIDKNTVIDYIIDHGQALDEQNIPETGRKLVIPAWMAALIKKSDLKDASITGDAVSIARNGRLGMIDRFELFVSNLLPQTAADAGPPAVLASTTVFAIHPRALTFASQLVKTETLRAESTFGTLMRGLMVYGRQVVLPEAMTQGHVYKA